ncbi:hypothetical protein EDD85DRAFT_790826 [Armillaria nabsnona]|nr:hypothetical protein EDD85DRAFT_790826 [Armillaria nabsnona]
MPFHSSPPSVRIVANFIDEISVSGGSQFSVLVQRRDEQVSLLTALDNDGKQSEEIVEQREKILKTHRRKFFCGRLDSRIRSKTTYRDPGDMVMEEAPGREMSLYFIQQASPGGDGSRSRREDASGWISTVLMGIDVRNANCFDHRNQDQTFGTFCPEVSERMLKRRTCLRTCHRRFYATNGLSLPPAKPRRKASPRCTGRLSFAMRRRIFTRGATSLVIKAKDIVDDLPTEIPNDMLSKRRDEVALDDDGKREHLERDVACRKREGYSCGSRSIHDQRDDVSSSGEQSGMVREILARGGVSSSGNGADMGIRQETRSLMPCPDYSPRFSTQKGDLKHEELAQTMLQITSLSLVGVEI